MRVSIVLTAILLFCSGCAAPPIPDARRQEPLGIPEGITTSEVALVKVVTRLAPNQEQLFVQHGWFCQPGINRTLPADRFPVPMLDLDRSFRKMFGSLRYTLQKERDSLFTPEIAAELQLGAAITGIQAALCFPMSGSPDLRMGDTSLTKGKVYMELTWELYSASAGKVLYKAEVPGSYASEDSVPGGVETMLLRAFSASLRNLTADPEFRAVVLKYPPR